MYLPFTDLAGAVSLGHRVCQVVAEKAFALADGSTLAITVSGGGAVADGHCPQELVGCADLALYAAKAAGRNRIVAETA